MGKLSCLIWEYNTLDKIAVAKPSERSSRPVPFKRRVRRVMIVGSVRH